MRFTDRKEGGGDGYALLGRTVRRKSPLRLERQFVL